MLVLPILVNAICAMIPLVGDDGIVIWFCALWFFVVVGTLHHTERLINSVVY